MCECAALVTNETKKQKEAFQGPWNSKKYEPPVAAIEIVSSTNGQEQEKRSRPRKTCIVYSPEFSFWIPTC